jgi:hypothetical protein
MVGGWDGAARSRVAQVCCVLVLGLTIVLAVWSVRLIRSVEERRTDRVSVPSDKRADVVLGTLGESSATALRRARSALAPGDLFALVVDPSTDRSAVGTFRLVAQHYLFPAIETADAEGAKVVVVIGARRDLIPVRFEPLLDAEGVWVGVRR